MEEQLMSYFQLVKRFFILVIELKGLIDVFHFFVELLREISVGR